VSLNIAALGVSRWIEVNDDRAFFQGFAERVREFLAREGRLSLEIGRRGACLQRSNRGQCDRGCQ
jgi:hypothetical protein